MRRTRAITAQPSESRDPCVQDWLINHQFLARTSCPFSPSRGLHTLIHTGTSRGLAQVRPISPSAHSDNTRPSIHVSLTNTVQLSRCMSDETWLRSSNMPSISDSSRRREERGYWLAAKIPPEILDNIVGHVPDCIEHQPEDSGSYVLQRRQPSSDIQDRLQPLRSCSLVCRRWANICRHGMFSMARLIFQTPEELDEFLAYSFNGCRGLVPIYKLIRWIGVEQRYDAKRSFCHRLNALPQDTASKIYQRLDLRGPVPDGLHSSMLSTPHWSLPPSITMPYSLSRVYGEINAIDIHMPSFSHVIRFISHFAYTKSWEIFPGTQMSIINSVRPRVTFHSLTWDNDRDYPPHFRKPVLYRRPYNSRSPVALSDSISVARCTNNIRLCLHALIARPTCCMHWMPDVERQWAFSFLTSLKDLLDNDRWQSDSCRTGTCKDTDFDGVGDKGKYFIIFSMLLCTDYLARL